MLPTVWDHMTIARRKCKKILNVHNKTFNSISHQIFGTKKFHIQLECRQKKKEKKQK